MHQQNTLNLKNIGLKVTLPRIKILDIFKNTDNRHMTAEDVFRRLIVEHSDIGLATVYRVLTQFEQAGILLKSNFDNGKAIYELKDGKHHDHLVCTSCGKVEEFFDVDIEKKQKTIASNLGWIIHDHSMTLYGLCNDCLAKQNQEINENY